MNILSAYKKSWQFLFQQKKIWFIFYGLNLLIGIISIIPLYQYLNNTIGKTIDFNESKPWLNFSFVTDFLSRNGDFFSFLSFQVLGCLLLNLLVSIFLVSGILAIIMNGEGRAGFADLIKGAAKYFWRFLRLALYFLIFNTVLLSVFGFVMFTIAQGFSMVNLTSEYEVINAFKKFFPIYLGVVILVTMIHDYSKICIIKNNEKWLIRSMWFSLKLCIKNIFSFTGFYLLNIATWILSFFLLEKIINQFDPNSIFSTVVLFAIIQIFIFFRAGLKIVNLAGASYLFSGVMKKEKSIFTLEKKKIEAVEY